MSKHSIVRWIKIIGVYLLVAAVAALPFHSPCSY